MARYTGPRTKIARKFGEPIFGEDKVLAKKNFPPGQHGQNKRSKTSEYGTQLREKQKAKYTYGVLENSSTTSLRKLRAPKASPAKSSFSFLKAASTTWFTALASLPLAPLPASSYSTATSW